MYNQGRKNIFLSISFFLFKQRKEFYAIIFECGHKIRRRNTDMDTKKREEKQNGKRASVLDAMEKLILDGKAASCSVTEIARAANMGKGSLYYYYGSKREIEIGLYYRTYGSFIEKCGRVLENQNNAVEKLKILFATYYGQVVDPAIDDYLHLPQNMDMHQKVLAKLVNTVSPILSGIIKQGVAEGVFDCGAPDEYAVIYATVLAFLFDDGIFHFSEEETYKKLAVFAETVERSLRMKDGYLSFMRDREFLLSLKNVQGGAAPFRLSNA
jgi:AcrR family transcriptional regulator